MLTSAEYEAKAFNLLEAGLTNRAQVLATLALVRAIKEAQDSSRVLMK
jgi:hypothetical protein